MRKGPEPITERFARERALAERMSQLGKRSLETMTPEQRIERAKKAVAAREAKRKKSQLLYPS
jgi:hypothetical protein